MVPFSKLFQCTVWFLRNWSCLALIHKCHGKKKKKQAAGPTFFKGTPTLYHVLSKFIVCFLFFATGKKKKKQAAGPTFFKGTPTLYHVLSKFIVCFLFFALSAFAHPVDAGIFKRKDREKKDQMKVILERSSRSLRKT